MKKMAGREGEGEAWGTHHDEAGGGRPERAERSATVASAAVMAWEGEENSSQRKSERTEKGLISSFFLQVGSDPPLHHQMASRPAAGGSVGLPASEEMQLPGRASRVLAAAVSYAPLKVAGKPLRGLLLASPRAHSRQPQLSADAAMLGR